LTWVTQKKEFADAVMEKVKLFDAALAEYEKTYDPTIDNDNEYFATNTLSKKMKDKDGKELPNASNYHELRAYAVELQKLANEAVEKVKKEEEDRLAALAAKAEQDRLDKEAKDRQLAALAAKAEKDRLAAEAKEAAEQLYVRTKDDILKEAGNEVKGMQDKSEDEILALDDDAVGAIFIGLHEQLTDAKKVAENTSGVAINSALAISTIRAAEKKAMQVLEERKTAIEKQRKAQADKDAAAAQDGVAAQLSAQMQQLLARQDQLRQKNTDRLALINKVNAKIAADKALLDQRKRSATADTDKDTNDDDTDDDDDNDDDDTDDDDDNDGDDNDGDDNGEDKDKKDDKDPDEDGTGGGGSSSDADSSEDPDVGGGGKKSEEPKKPEEPEDPGGDPNSGKGGDKGGDKGGGKGGDKGGDKGGGKGGDQGGDKGGGGGGTPTGGPIELRMSDLDVGKGMSDNKLNYFKQAIEKDINKDGNVTQEEMFTFLNQTPELVLEGLRKITSATSRNRISKLFGLDTDNSSAIMDKIKELRNIDDDSDDSEFTDASGGELSEAETEVADNDVGKLSDPEQKAETPAKTRRSTRARRQPQRLGQ
jgi:hypothetical protein